MYEYSLGIVSGRAPHRLPFYGLVLCVCSLSTHVLVSLQLVVAHIMHSLVSIKLLNTLDVQEVCFSERRVYKSWLSKNKLTFTKRRMGSRVNIFINTSDSLSTFFKK